jgi:glycosyltransferase involved in cell wall biosynthesis
LAKRPESSDGTPVKITHLNPALTKGGAEKVLVDLANLAVARGHEVNIVSARKVDPALLQDQVDPRVKLHFVTSEGSGKYAAYAAMLPWLARNWPWLRQQDVVHCHMTYGALLGSAIRLGRSISGRKTPLIVETFHGVGMPIRPWQRSLAALQAAACRDGYALMAEDDYWRDFAAGHPFLPLATIANGIAQPPKSSKAERLAYRREAGIPGDAPVIGTVGRLRAERNPLATVAAFAAAARELGPDVHFLMAGDGPMTDAVRAEGDRLGLAGRLHLPGLAVKPWVAATVLDLYVSMNVGPITGIAGLEAAASGVPVIALQATADYAGGAQDWIWSDADPAKVGAEAARLLQAPQERQAMAARQAAYVRAHHSADAMFDSYLALYKQAGAGR